MELEKINADSMQGFIAPWWARNRHLQTIWGSLFRRFSRIESLYRKRIELEDGDFIDVDILPVEKTSTEQTPTVLLLHGLEGSIDSPYIRGMLAACQQRGWQVIVKHFRSCSGEPNRLPRSYNSGVSDDLEQIMQALTHKGFKIDFAAGYSLGGNVLLKWLGEQQQNVDLKAAVAVSVPLRLDVCATEIHRGFSRVYEFLLLKSLRDKTRLKKRQHPSSLFPDEKKIKQLNSFWRFDHHVTAPLHGYASAQDYYEKASSKQFLKTIHVPTLVIQSEDDPFMNQTVIPQPNEYSDSVVIERSQHGGHVGFVDGKWPWTPSYYLERRIPSFLEQFIQTKAY